MNAGPSWAGHSIRRLLALRPTRQAWAATLVGVTLATLLRWACAPLAATIVPFPFYFPVVAWAGYVGGLRVAAGGTVASAAVASLLFMPPEQPATDRAVNAVLFVVAAMAVGWLGAALRHARLARIEVEALYETVQDVTLDGVIVYQAVRDEAGRIADLERIAMNRAAERIVGPARQMLGLRYLESSPTLNRERLFERYAEVLQTGIPAEDEFLLEAGRRWIFNRAVRVGPDRIAITFRDVTETRATIERQKFLMRELNHRVKNVLTSVLSLARQTSAAGSAAQYRDALAARISAMARAHDLLMTESWEGAMLADVVSQTLAPYDRVQADGPSVSVASDLALALNMVLHELATNAAKYGALSVPGGHVEVLWRLDGEPAGVGGGRVTLSWVERGGPAVQEPTHAGFGSRLLGRGFAASGRTITLSWLPEGLCCDLCFDALSAARDSLLPTLSS